MNVTRHHFYFNGFDKPNLAALNQPLSITTADEQGREGGTPLDGPKLQPPTESSRSTNIFTLRLLPRSCWRFKTRNQVSIFTACTSLN